MSYTIVPKDLKSPVTVVQETSRLDTISPAPSNIDSKGAPQGASLPPLGTPQAPSSNATGEALNAKPASAVAETDPRIADLERKEIALRETARRIQAEKAELEALKRAPAAPSNAMTAEQWKELFMQDPAKVGIDYQDMANKYLTQPTEQDQKYSALEKQVAELKAQLGQGEQSIKKAQEEAYQNAVNQMKAETQRIVESSPGDYELIAAQGQHDAVVALIEATYKEEKILMSPKQAADKVEEYLLERALKVAGLKKVREKTSPSFAEAAEKKTQEPRTTPTLSQSMQANAPMTPRERAIAAFNRKLQ